MKPGTYSARKVITTIAVVAIVVVSVGVWKGGNGASASIFNISGISPRSVTTTAGCSVTQSFGGSPASGIVFVSPSNNTNGVPFSQITLRANGNCAANITSLRMNVGGGIGQGGSIPTFFGAFTLFNTANGGTILDTEPATATTTFRNFSLTIQPGQSVNLALRANINAWNYGVKTASINSIGFSAVDPSNGNVLPTTGTAVGNIQVIEAAGIRIDPLGTPTATVIQPGGTAVHSTVTYTTPFSVTAFGHAEYIPSTAIVGASAGNATHFVYSIDNGSATPITTGTTGIIVYTGNSTLTPDSNGNYLIPVGQTANFQLTATFQPTTAGSYRSSLIGAAYSQISATAYAGNPATGYAAYAPFLLGTNAYRTPYVAAQ